MVWHQRWLTGAPCRNSVPRNAHRVVLSTGNPATMRRMLMHAAPVESVRRRPPQDIFSEPLRSRLFERLVQTPGRLVAARNALHYGGGPCHHLRIPSSAYRTCMTKQHRRF